MTTVEMLALLFAFTMVGGIAFVLVGNTGIWRAVPGARKPGHNDDETTGR